MSILSSPSPSQRKNTIQELLKQDAEVRVNDLAERFGISSVTIRNDLAEMEEEGLLRRTHGGAVSTKKSYFNMSLNDRMKVNREEKMRIAKACAALIKGGDTLMADSGTTTRYLAKELAGRSNLTIVTNAMQIAEEFVYNNSVNVILLGGNLDLQYQFTYGTDTISQLQKYRADKMILAIDGISVKHGLSTYHYLEADVSRLMIDRANTVIAVADHSKIGKEGFSHIDPITSVDILVTGRHEENIAELDEIRIMGIDVKEV
jgi:DeoR/GlpR family transcriptional regulator of sugar metabolism